MLTSSPFYC